METTPQNIEELWDFRDLEKTEKRFRDILGELSSDQEDFRNQLFTQIARIQGLRGKFEEGHQLLAKINLDKANDLTKVRYLLEKGRLNNSDMKRELAIDHFLQAWELARIAELHYFAVDAGHMLGIAEENPKKQIEWNRKALNYAEASGDVRAQSWLGALYNNTAWSLFDQEKYEEALDLFERALLWREEKGDINTIRIAKWSIGRVHRALGNYQTALQIQKELEAEYLADDGQVSGYTLEELAELYFILEENSQARDYFHKAYNSLLQDPWLQKNEPERLARLKRLSN